MDPFATLQIEPTLDLDLQDLERRYLALSRECHPDFHLDADPAETTAILQRAADLNRSYKLLKDRWHRAESLVRLLDPDAMERTKSLAPDFLMEAMEWAEDVAMADGPDDALAARLESAVEAAFDATRRALADGDAGAAATALHQSRYSRKALADLRAADGPSTPRT